MTFGTVALILAAGFIEWIYVAMRLKAAPHVLKVPIERLSISGDSQ